MIAVSQESAELIGMGSLRIDPTGLQRTYAVGKMNYGGRSSDSS